MIRNTTLVAGAVVAGLLVAAPARADVALNPAKLELWLYEDKTDNAKGIVSRYQVRARGEVVGTVGDHDRMTLAWQVGGKTVTTVDCELQALQTRGNFQCEGKDSLDAFGDVTAVLSYVTDADDKSVALHTMNLKVGRFWQWYMRGSKTLHHARYQVMPMDLLGSAVVTYEESFTDQPNATMRVSTWMLRAGDTELPRGETLRCTVDGKKLPDVEAKSGDTQIVEAEDWRGPNADKHAVHWERREFTTDGLLWGTADTLNDSWKAERTSGAIKVLGDHPGAWACDWRAKGTVIRQFAWVVGADGRIKPHAEQTTGFKLPPRMAMIDVTVPDGAPDKFFDAAIVRTHGFYGRPWSAPTTGKNLKHTKTRPGLELAPPKGAKAAPKAKAKKRR